ncbi:hypothetical protein GCM10010116_09130 [Microbispora rosea subsp. aerata]|nr:hypothetical protein GCM10010116_09130 [Microbispora rosea subsp. aerata]GIH56309.1 hypothetical protein Mro02_32230 [Microbispora rosea subsp. aerata]GLJ82250.1 hypothetical protein GCM10017588_09750 [Microbispora rosea subsp. aerata]
MRERTLQDAGAEADVQHLVQLVSGDLDGHGLDRWRGHEFLPTPLRGQGRAREAGGPAESPKAWWTPVRREPRAPASTTAAGVHVGAYRPTATARSCGRTFLWKLPVEAR